MSSPITTEGTHCPEVTSLLKDISNYLESVFTNGAVFDTSGNLIIPHANSQCDIDRPFSIIDFQYASDYFDLSTLPNLTPQSKFYTIAPGTLSDLGYYKKPGKNTNAIGQPFFLYIPPNLEHNPFFDEIFIKMHPKYMTALFVPFSDVLSKFNLKAKSVGDQLLVDLCNCKGMGDTTNRFKIKGK